MSKLIAAALAALALFTAGCASDKSQGDQSRSTGQFTDDAALTARVKTAIATDVGAGTAANVNVTTYRGEVQLSGFVDSEDNAKRAADAARNVSGVRMVKNDLQVKSAASGR